MKCIPVIGDYTLISSLMKVLDPESGFVIKWRRFILIIGIMSLILDPFFIYVPCAKGPQCLGIDVKAGHFIAAIRTLLDLFHLLHIVLKFHIAFEGKGPRVFKSRNLVVDPHMIAIHYFKSRFILDLLAILPLPQISIWAKVSSDDPNKLFPEMLSSTVLLQFGLRMISMVPYKLFNETGIVIRNIWSGAVVNLFIFILVGHFLGAYYYQIYLNKLWECLSTLSQEEMNTINSPVIDCRQLHKLCVAKNTELDKGMHSSAFENEIGVRSYTQKFIYCFVWGVRSLSSLGQIFDATYDVWETTFSCVVIIAGLVLLADLIARMQTSVQSAGARREQQRIKQRRLEEWTHYHDLPPDLKGLVRQSIQSEWQCTKGMDDEAILNSLPWDLRRDIRTHLYKERVANIPPFSRMDEQLLNFICGHLRTFTGAEGSYIVLQGDPLERVVFVFSGLLQLTHHSGGRSNTRSLETGDFFGDDLLTWASQPNSSTQNLPPSNFTVKCISNVEAFCLPAEHVRLLVIFNYFQRFQRALREHHA